MMQLNHTMTQLREERDAARDECARLREALSRITIYTIEENDRDVFLRIGEQCVAFRQSGPQGSILLALDALCRAALSAQQGGEE